MKRILKRIFKWGALSLGTLAIVLVAGVYGVAQWRLHHTYGTPLPVLSVTPDPALAEEGQRLATAFGCLGCHRNAGNVLFDQPDVGRLVAPNLSRVVPSYTDAELARVIRNGVKRDGTTVIAMPTAALSHIADADLAAMIAFLRARPEVPDAIADGTQWRTLGLIGMALHKVPIGADAPQDPSPPTARPSQTSVAQGRYLVSVTCRACHALHEVTDDGFGMVTPPLVDMAMGYSGAEFRTLLSTGKASGDREVGLMSEIARGDLAALSDAERDAIHAYLLSATAAQDP